MHKKLNSWVLSACIVSATPLIATEVLAASSADGANTVVCATTDVIACTEGATCIQGTAKSLELPEFVIFDKTKKVIRAAYESGQKHTSPVTTVEQGGDHLILQGIENNRGWNMTINKKNGDMSAALAGEGVSFLIFGNCTAL